MAPRANWKGHLILGEVSCRVALYTAASTSERIAFHTINRKTGNRLQMRFVDAGTGQPVAREDEVKGYEIAPDDHVVLTPQEVAAAVPESDKALRVEAFIDCAEIDTLYLDRPYYLAPAEPASDDVFALIREGMRADGVAALARAVLFRRLRTVLIRPQGPGLVGATLNFDHEVRSADAAFADIPDLTIKGEMLDLAEHIIATKTGDFDPADFDDRYEAALADLVKAKLEGRPLPARKPARREKVVDLLAALRESAASAGKRKPAKADKVAPRRKAG